MNTPEKYFIIPCSLAQAIVNYLAARPYAEVAQFVPQLLSMKPVELSDMGDGQIITNGTEMIKESMISKPPK